MLIVFNVLFFATFACLIKPRLLSPYIGGKVLSRAWFVAALMLLGALSPYTPSLPTREPSQPSAAPASRSDTPTMAAPAASSSHEQAAVVTHSPR